MEIDQVLEWRGADVVDRDGDKIGRLEEIYLDQETDKPEWAAVKTGLLGSKLSFIPLIDAAQEGGVVRVPFQKQQVKDAPGVEPDGELSQQEEANLYRHYGVDYDEGRSGTGLPEAGQDAGDIHTHAHDHDHDHDHGVGDPTTQGSPGVVGRDVSGPETDNAMTRSEEELTVGKVQREAGRARLRKYIVTERVTQTVPVQREEVRIEREPITDANAPAAHDGPALTEEEHEVTLTQEEAVAEKRVVPKERIRMDKDVVTEERQVTEDVSKEQVEIDDAGSAGGRGTDRI